MRAKARQRVHRTEVEWRKILDRFEASGRSQEAFCRESGIPVTTLQAVRRRLRDRTRTPAPARFIDVTPVAASMAGSAARWSIEIEFPDGTTARVRS